ncbi:DUF192 domain-containing protein [Boseongicola aestuarii]|uniref:ACR n=1 Tax=Boseongicola aestuarii TaxID=1470561 RepID=A0A238IWP8_9RHOB|nr:hypothetical protein BOA8489_00558 [Boseongicola aestuarii]
MTRTALFSFLTTIATATAAFSACSETHVDLKGDWGQARFMVEVADDPAERSQGLMNRENMARSAGMLFVYEFPQRVAFWMRNTLIPLDMIFLDDTGTVQRVHENAIPLDETAIPGGDNIQYVLEINAGLAALYGIDEGTVLRHPSIGENAVWGCKDEN